MNKKQWAAFWAYLRGEWPQTLEARRQLIWAAKQEGWRDAAVYLKERGQDDSAHILMMKLKEELLDPAPR